MTQTITTIKLALTNNSAKHVYEIIGKTKGIRAKLNQEESNAFREQQRGRYYSFETGIYKVDFQSLYTNYPIKPSKNILCDETSKTLSIIDSMKNLIDGYMKRLHTSFSEFDQEYDDILKSVVKITLNTPRRRQMILTGKNFYSFWSVNHIFIL